MKSRKVSTRNEKVILPSEGQKHQSIDRFSNQNSIGLSIGLSSFDWMKVGIGTTPAFRFFVFSQ